LTTQQLLQLIYFEWGNLILSTAATVILIPLLIYFCRYYWDYRRWKSYERLIRTWASSEFGLETLTEEDWKAIAAVMLIDVGFEPSKVNEFLELGVSYAKGVASHETFEKIGFRKEDAGG
jgi:hypothetical protein